MGTDPQIITSDKAIIFFDGVCNLCNGAVRFIIKRDPDKYFKFASLQSASATKILSGYQMNPLEMESIILVDKTGVHLKSTAAIQISKRLSGIWPLFAIFRIFPSRLRDVIYDWIAHNRYRWFGRRDQCMVPTDGMKSRFLED